mgnify:CR=1 FL=1
MNRLRESFVLVRNPMNYHQVSRVSLRPAVIDCAVFWTKNAAPTLPLLAEIEQSWPFYFQYTLNAYGKEIEPGLPAIQARLQAFQALSRQIGPGRVIWRYDPVLLTDAYTVDWHIAQFGQIAAALRGCTETCVFSFVDLYPKVQHNVKGLAIRGCEADDMNRLAEAFSRMAGENGMELRTCAEAVDLDRFGIRHGCCVDGALIQRLIGWKLTAKKDPSQRPECGCLESVDIGQYNTCRHGCKYCYATFNPQSVITLSGRHDPSSPFLVGGPEPDDRVTERKMKSLKAEESEQMSLL